MKDFTAEEDAPTAEEVELYLRTLTAQQYEFDVETGNHIRLKLSIIESLTKIMHMEAHPTTPEKYDKIQKEAEKLLITTIKSIKLEK